MSPGNIVEKFAALEVGERVTTSDLEPLKAIIVAHPTDSSWVVQTLENVTPTVFCLLDEASICSSGCDYQPKLQDIISITKFERRPTIRGVAFYVQEYECEEIADFEQGEEVLGVVEKIHSTMISIVGRSFPKATLVACSFPVEIHDFVVGEASRIRDGYVLKEMFGTMAVLKDDDAECEEQSVRAVGVCILKMRPLTASERNLILTNCSRIEDITLHQAQMFIRDVYICLTRMENHVRKLSVVEHTVTVRGVSDIDRGTAPATLRITVNLSRREADQCIRSQTLESWIVGNKISVWHPDMAGRDGKTLPQTMIIDKIRSAGGVENVLLKPAPESKALFDMFTQCNHIFDEEEPFTVGPSDDDQDTVSDNIDAFFSRFFGNRELFDAWRGCGDPDESLVPNMDKEFKVKDRCLDRSQQKALRTAVHRKGFTSVEAPPGSGKTMLISGIVGLKNEEGLTSAICLTAQTNVAITNAIEVTKKNYPEIKMCRQFSKASEAQLDEKHEDMSLSHMAKSPSWHVDLPREKAVRKSLERYHSTGRKLAEVSDIRRGLEAVKAHSGAVFHLKSNFLKAYGPKLFGTTCEMVARRHDPLEKRVALQLKEGRSPPPEDLAKCVTHLIIDEASQLSPTMALAVYCALPLLDQVTVIGDPKQLGPFTRLEKDSFANKLICGGELARLQEKRTTSQTRLSFIYRCHPRISDLVLKPIYGDHLKTGITAEDRALAVQQGLPVAQDQSPVLFVHVDGECIDGYNEKEALAALRLVDLLKEKGVQGEEVAIVCNHRRQRQRIEAKLKRDTPMGAKINVKTVDSFQGMEAKVVLVLTTKTCKPNQNPRKVLSFVADFSRGTVAVSRAQHTVYMFGQWDKLVQTDFWGQFVPSIIKSRALVTSNFEEASGDLYDLISQKKTKKKSGRFS